MSDLHDQIVKGLEKREFVAYYQPQYDTLTGKMTGAEALIRWVKPDGELVPPVKFIPYAEECGLVTKLDWYMLRQVCQFQKDRIKENEKVVPIAVNFSRCHLPDPEFVEKIEAVVNSYQLPHELIVIELTETAMMNHNADTIAIVKKMRDMGFAVAIDDFGSGMSSVRLLHDIDANILKIDRSLLSGNCETDKERILLESIISIAQRIGMHTIAEGVETEQQLGFLRTCGCTAIQGFLFARPMPEEEFIASFAVTEPTEDILQSQSAIGTMNLLTNAVFNRFPLIIMANLTRNSYYMMAYENFNQHTCAASGEFDDLIVHGTSTMHEEDKELFDETFSRENLLKAYERGESHVRAVTRQIGVDGIYRPVETDDYFVKSPSSDDILVIVFCQNVPE